MENENILEQPAQPAPAPNASKLSVWKTIKVGLAFFTVTIFWQVYNSVMPLFLKDYNLNKTQTGLVMSIGYAVALFMLPLMGMASDKLPKKWQAWGKRIPFIVIGSVLAAVAFLLINYAHAAHMPAGAARSGADLWVMLLFVIFTVTFMALYRTPAVSLMPDVTLKKHRSTANAVINLMGGVGGVIGMGLMMFMVKSEYNFNVTPGAANAVRVPGLTENDGWVEALNGFPQKFISGEIMNNWLLFGIVSALMIIAAAMLIFLVKENKLVEEKRRQEESEGIDEDENSEGVKAVSAGNPFRNLTGGERKSLVFLLLSIGLWYFAYTAVTTHFSDFCWVRLQMDNFALPFLIAQAAGFVLFYPAAVLGKKIGRKRTVQLGVLMFTAGMAIASVLMLPGIPDGVIRGFMYLVFLLIGAGWATINVHSFVMSVEFSDKRNNGFFTGLYYVAVNAAQIATPILAGVFMDIDYSLLMPYGLVFIALAFITMLFVKHGDVK